ncbi:MAG: NAD-dependent epimerase/dehydratase family protein [Rhodobacteraceae bacterium]|nr:NAD-dependent epimerase/dehydratase family protein [Paracoccaceae bacterium]
MTGTVLILGSSGAFGGRAAEAFGRAGWQVRLFRRGTDMGEAARGADVIVNGLNPPRYHDWPGLIPRITAEVISAARASGATLIQPANVYVYGREPGPWTEETPHRPVSRKGAIRSAMERDLMAATRDGVRVILLRAGDFIDPANPRTVTSMIILRGFARGRLMRMGPLATTRAYAYLPDMARAIVALAEKRDELAPYESINMPGDSFSMTTLKEMIEARTGRALRVSTFPWWMMRLASPVWELARELTEMRYLYEMSHAMADARFSAVLPDFKATPLATVVDEHIRHPLPGRQDTAPARAG